MTMRTRCVGRFLIDLPDTFVWAETPYATLYYGLDADHKTVDVQIIDSESGSEKFKARVQKRVNAISAEVNSESEESMLIEVRSLDRSRMLIRYYRTYGTTRSHTNEVHMLSGRVHVLLKADSFPEDTTPVEAKLVRLSEQVTVFGGPNDARPGFCLGPVLINSNHDHEVISTFARDKRRRDVMFEVYMSAITPDEEEGLIDRIEREKVAFSTSPKFLRKGRTTLGGMEAEEALMRFEENGITTHSFAIWSRRPDPSFNRPMITLNLTTGGDVPTDLQPPDPLRYGVDVRDDVSTGPVKTITASLQDEEAILLWDSVARSVKLRTRASGQ